MRQAGLFGLSEHLERLSRDGDPLEVGSTPVKVFIDGVEQPLENHQSRLRDRYRDLDTNDLPKGYDW